MSAIDLSTKVALSEFRKRLFDLIHEVTTDPLAVISIMRRAAPSASLVSSERFGPLFQAMRLSDHDAWMRQILLWLIVEHWLFRAPLHLQEAQRRELSVISLEHLQALFALDPSTATAASLKSAGIDAQVAERLVKRRKVAHSIARAKQAGLYEAVDHKASEAL